MKTILHISDLHFGMIDPTLASHLGAAFSAFHPDLVIVSGDLTQRATKKQFEAAKSLLDDLEKAGIRYLVVPGNHDIEPFYDPLSRLITPYRTYKRFISKDLEPRYQDDEIAVAGINSVNRFAAKEGIVFRGQIEKAARWLGAFPSSVTKIIVSHHQIENANAAQKESIDLFLSGHHHKSSVVVDATIEVQAGTLSLRDRGELASFNVIKIDMADITIETYLWDAKGTIFTMSSTKSFRLEDRKWK